MGVDNVFHVVSAPGRCLRASPGWTAAIAGAILLIAAALKAWQQNRYPFSTSGLRSLPGFAPALIGWEIFLGLWLIGRILPRAAGQVAIGCFSLFACYALYEALLGRASCGCFGQVHLNPWYTFNLDIAIVFALAFFGSPDGKQTKPSQWSQRKWPVAAALGIGLAAGIGSAVLHPKPVTAANGLATTDGGKLVVLELHKWLGHRLPVLKDIVAQGGGNLNSPQGWPGRLSLRAGTHRNVFSAAITGKQLGKRLAIGQWVVMFYHASCEVCRQTIPVYEALARREAVSGKAPHVAFIRVPSDPPASAPPGLFDTNIALHGTLDYSHEWFAATPIVVELRNGIVYWVTTGGSAMNLDWRDAIPVRRD